jgi:hypothetical protein
VLSIVIDKFDLRMRGPCIQGNNGPFGMVRIANEVRGLYRIQRCEYQ